MSQNEFKAQGTQDEFKVLSKSGEFDDDDVIYIALDALLDTRLGTLGKIDPNLAATALRGNYRSRFVDEFEGISKEDFKNAYMRRDIDTLKMSMVTNVSILIRRIIKDSLAIAVQQQKITRINIDVNVWPYLIDTGPLADMLVACVRAHAYENAVVRVISCPPWLLTPDYIREKYQLMIMYDWLEWLEIHKPFFEKKGIPGVTLIAPQLFVERAPTTEEHNKFGSGADGDVFRITEKIFAPMFRLNLMPASLFSVIDELTKENAVDRMRNVLVTADALEDSIKKVAPTAKITKTTQKPPVIDLDDEANEGGNEDELL